MSKRPARFTRDQIMSDPELFESVGQFILAHEIDNNYAYLRNKNLSHEEATIKSRQMAGLDVKDDSPVAAQNAADVALVQRYKNAKEARKVPGLKKENKRMAGEAAKMIDTINYLQAQVIESNPSLLKSSSFSEEPINKGGYEHLLDEKDETINALRRDLRIRSEDANELRNQLNRSKEEGRFGSRKHSKQLAGVVLAALLGGAGTNEIIEYLQGPTIEEREYYR